MRTKGFDEDALIGRYGDGDDGDDDGDDGDDDDDDGGCAYDGKKLC